MSENDSSGSAVYNGVILDFLHKEKVVGEIRSIPRLYETKKTQYSPEYIHSKLEEIRSKTYEFGNHKLKLTYPVNARMKCSQCNLDTFAKDKPIVLLHCRHAAHERCSYTKNFGMPFCRDCQSGADASFIKTHENASDFLDDIELSCIEKKCSLSLRHHAFHPSVSPTADTLFEQAVNETVESMFEYMGSEVAIYFFKKLTYRDLIPPKSNIDFTQMAFSIASETRTLPRPQIKNINLNSIKQKIDHGNEACPSPVTNCPEITFLNSNMPGAGQFKPVKTQWHLRYPSIENDNLLVEPSYPDSTHALSINTVNRCLENTIRGIRCIPPNPETKKTQHSPEHIHSKLEEMRSRTYEFGNHKLKLTHPINARMKCSQCDLDIFTKDKTIVLLKCRHVAHHSCSTHSQVYRFHCQDCNENVSYKEHQNATDFLDDIKLSCINEECTLSLRHHTLQQSISQTADTLLEQAANEAIDGMYTRLGAEITVSYLKILDYRDWISPGSNIDFKQLALSIVNEISTLPRPQIRNINIDSVKQEIDPENGVCPSPISKFMNEPAELFLCRNQKYLTNFIANEIRQNDYFSTPRNASDNVTYRDGEGIFLDCSGYVNICMRLSSLLSYRIKDIETGSTGADAFRKFKEKFYTDLAMLDLMYHKGWEVFSRKEGKTHLCTDWNVMEDTVTIKKGNNEARLQLSNFVNYAEKKVDLLALEQEVIASGFMYQELIHYRVIQHPDPAEVYDHTSRRL